MAGSERLAHRAQHCVGINRRIIQTNKQLKNGRRRKINERAEEKKALLPQLRDE